MRYETETFQNFLETETLDFWTEAETVTFKNETETFFETLHTNALYVCFNAITTMTVRFAHLRLFFNTLNKHLRSL